VFFPAHHFWSHIPWRAAGVLGVIDSELPGNAQISDSDVALGVKYYIFRFDIAMDDLVFVEVLKSNEDVGHEELGLSFVEVAFVAEMVAEVASV
jgi:hypothetical protein